MNALLEPFGAAAALFSQFAAHVLLATAIYAVVVGQHELFAWLERRKKKRRGKPKQSISARS